MKSQTLPMTVKEGRRHNVKYWRRQPYLGFGLDAHSMIRTPGRMGHCALAITDLLTEYLRGETATHLRAAA